MNFSINRHMVKAMELLSKSPALRRFFYVMTALLLIWRLPDLLAVIRWW